MRLFVAVFPPPGCAQALERALAALRAAASGVRWVDAKTAHFTLAFIGDFEDAARPAAALKRACSRGAAFDARLGAAGAFDSWDRPKILWLGLASGEEPMSRLAEAVRAELSAEKIRFDPKPFVPHLTLGRAKGNPPRELRRLIERALAGADFPPGRIEAVDLVSSKTGPQGPVYASVAREALCAA